MSLGQTARNQSRQCRAVALALCALFALCAVPVALGQDANTLVSPPNVSVSVVAPMPKGRNRVVRSQLPSVATPVAYHYAKADSVALALAVVPDPLVPRYRRLFDLHVLALELGMLKDGYVLDRFSFPWSEDFRHANESHPPTTDPIKTNLYGLMIFRCDGWRGNSCNYPTPPNSVSPAGETTRIRALYIIPETATTGVGRFAFECAIRRVEADTGITSPEWPEPQDKSKRCPEPESVPPRGVRATLLNHTQCPLPPKGAHNLVVLGPSFSGAMNSIGETVEGRIPDPNRHVCLVSSMATDSTNGAVVRKYSSIFYVPMALDDARKLEHLERLSEWLDPKKGHRGIAILTEASTFGYGICARDNASPDAQVPGLCDHATRFFFPPTIADIAYGLHKQEAQEASDLANVARQIHSDRHLSLEGGAEDGSEFPVNESPSVTAASNQLQLEQVMIALANSVPKIVIVVATDVRDRLFLFDQLRERLPRAMLVDLEADNLLAHPEFLHASRGALAVASVNLNSVGSVFPPCDGGAADLTRASWSVDGQGILADNIAHLYEADLGAPAATLSCGADGPSLGRQAALQLVTFQGLKAVSYAFPNEPPRLGKARRPNFDYLIFTEVLGVLFCAGLALLWLWPWSLQFSDKARGQSAANVKHRERYIVGAALISAALFLPMALFVAHNSTDRIGHPLMYWLVAIAGLGLIALWRCYNQISSTSWAAQYPSYSALWLSVVLALFSVGFPIAAACVSYRLQHSEGVISPVLLNALGFDPGSGVAFYLVTAIAGIMTLHASAIAGTRTWVVRRNFRLLVLAREEAMRQRSPVQPLPSFVPQEVKDAVHNLHGYRPLPMWTTVLICTLLILAAGAPGILDYLGGPRLTVFGPWAARVAVLALAATTLSGSILLTAAYGAGRRVTALCGYVRGRILDSTQSLPGAEIPGLWTGGSEMPNSFPATPVLATGCPPASLSQDIWTGATIPADAGIEDAGHAWASELSKILYQGMVNSRSRFALFALLVSELSLFRWIAMGAVLSAFASVGIVFLYPIEADTLLMLNLLILTLTGLLCAYLAVMFERDGVLSNIVCNRPQKAEFSFGLFAFIAMPFVVLSVAIALIEIPGVVDWAGGLFVMMRSLGVHP